MPLILGYIEAIGMNSRVYVRCKVQYTLKSMVFKGDQEIGSIFTPLLKGFKWKGFTLLGDAYLTYIKYYLWAMRDCYVKRTLKKLPWVILVVARVLILI